MVWGAVASAVAGSVINKALEGGGDSASSINRQQYQHQKEFAQKGIQWKVDDAKAAGLHPLAALGAQTMAYQPSYVGQDQTSSMGQDISRAVMQGFTSKQRENSQAQARATELALENQNLQNELLRSQINRMNQAQLAPAPASQQPHVVVPNEILAEGAERGITSGQHPGFTKVKMPSGGSYLLPSKDTSEAFEAMGSIPTAAITAYQNMHYAGKTLIGRAKENYINFINNQRINQLRMMRQRGKY